MQRRNKTTPERQYLNQSVLLEPVISLLLEYLLPFAAKAVDETIYWLHILPGLLSSSNIQSTLA